MLKVHPRYWLRGFLGSPGFVAWTLFLVLNVIINLPFFLFNREDWHLIPIPGIDLYSWQELIFTREHIDLLRMSAELSLTMAIWALFGAKWDRKGRVWFWRSFLVFFIFALVYKTYAAALTGLYQVQPNFYSDYRFLSGGLPFFFSAMDLPWWLFFISGLGLSVLFLTLRIGTRLFFLKTKPDELGTLHRIIWCGIGLISLVYCFRFGPDLAEPEAVINSLVVEVAENIRQSLATKRVVAGFDPTIPFTIYDYSRFTLEEKPDIYLIFMESYGSVLYTKDYFREPYLEFVSVFEKHIEALGWQTASIYSESPTWGGGTWMAYTSAMFGLSVPEQSKYAVLHQAYQKIPYPHLGRYFHLQGYEYVWITPIGQRISAEREEKDIIFWGADRWITLDSMGYKGPLYGWGPSPPDQFTLRYVADFVRDQTQPTFLVFLTQNTHYPYTPLPPLVDDAYIFTEIYSKTTEMETNTGKEQVFRETRQHYMNAVEYTFAALETLITHIQDPDAIVVLLGDHQPPAVSYKGDGYATMIHILSQDEDFVRGFMQYGFSPGLVLETPQGTFAETGMKHEGFYSMFVRNVVECFGTDDSNLPPYLPNGLEDRTWSK